MHFCEVKLNLRQVKYRYVVDRHYHKIPRDQSTRGLEVDFVCGEVLDLYFGDGASGQFFLLFEGSVKGLERVQDQVLVVVGVGVGEQGFACIELATRFGLLHD
jgi:hypothetical protein